MVNSSRRWFRRPTITVPPAGPPFDPPVANPDHAWKALSLVNDWVRHAEAKTAATLAATGVTGGVLYNLVKDQHHPSVLSVVLRGCLRRDGLRCRPLRRGRVVPRMRLARAQEDPVNILYFDHIARRYVGDGDRYALVLRDLTTRPEDLTRQLAHQVHANSTVARRKFLWANRSIRALAVALVALGLVAVLIGGV